MGYPKEAKKYTEVSEGKIIMAENEFILDIDPEEYDTLTSKYVEIPANNEDGIEREGDTIVLNAELGMAEWKTQGKSLRVPVIITEEGANQGKEMDWFVGISKDAMQVTKPRLQRLGIENKVLPRKEGKLHLNFEGFVAVKCAVKVVREMSQNGNLRSVLQDVLAPKESNLGI